MNIIHITTSTTGSKQPYHQQASDGVISNLLQNM